MRAYQAVGLLLSFVVSSSLLPAQTSDPGDLAKQIVRRSLAAMTSGRVPASIVADGITRNAAGDESKIRIKARGPRKFRYEYGEGAPGLLVVSNGGGRHRGKDKDWQIPSWRAAYLRPEQFPLLSRMAEVEDPQTQAAYIAEEVLSGNRVHHIELWSLPANDSPPEIERLISEAHVFIDAESSLVVMIRTFMFSPTALENRTAIDSYFSDYHTMNGVSLPYKSSRYIMGKLDSEVILETIQTDIPIDESEFE